MPKQITNDRTPGALERDVDLSQFLEDYLAHARRFGLNKDPWLPEHNYDYYGYWDSIGKKPFQADEEGHLPSSFKGPNHPRRFLPDASGQMFDTTKPPGRSSSDFFIPPTQDVPMPRGPGPMMGPSTSGPRSLLTPQLLDLIARQSQPQGQTWEQILGRRYLDAITGKNPHRTGYNATPHYPEMRSFINELPREVVEIAMRAGVSPQELLTLIMRGM